MLIRYLLLLSLAGLLFSCNNDKPVHRPQEAIIELKTALTEKSDIKLYVKSPINTENEAIAATEPVLFKAYGKENILGEKPYSVDLVNKYWVLSGSLPDGNTGGVFLIILSISDGKIVKIIHGK